MLIFENRKDMIQHYVKPGMAGCELGVFAGEFAVELFALQPSQLYLIDAWQGDEKGELFSADENGNNHKTVLANDLKENVARIFANQPNVHILCNWTQDAIPTLPDNSLDYVYIDADHSYEGVKRDLELILPKMKQRCLIMGHDYEVNFDKAGYLFLFGVKKAVDEFCLNHDFRLVAKGMDGYVSYVLERMGQESEIVFDSLHGASELYRSGIFQQDMSPLYSAFHKITGNATYLKRLGYLQSQEEWASWGVWSTVLETMPPTFHYVESAVTNSHCMAFLKMRSDETGRTMYTTGFGQTEILHPFLHGAFACMNAKMERILVLPGSPAQFQSDRPIDLLHISSQSTQVSDIQHLLSFVRPGGYMVASYATGAMQNRFSFTPCDYAFGKMLQSIADSKNLQDILAIGHLRIWQVPS